MRDDGQNVGWMRGEEEVGRARCLEDEGGEGKEAASECKQQTALVSRRLCLWISDAERAALPQKGFTPIDRPQYILYR